MATQDKIAIIKQAIVRNGCFAGCKKDAVAVCLLEDVHERAVEISKAAPNDIFGTFAEESKGFMNMHWYRNGQIL